MLILPPSSEAARRNPVKIHQLRNATFVIESGALHVLVDPMLSEVGKLPPFAHFRHKPMKNPVIPLPDNAPDILGRVTHCLVTHSQKLGIRALQHTDHLDESGESFLREKTIPVITRAQDAAYLNKHGLAMPGITYAITISSGFGNPSSPANQSTLRAAGSAGIQGAHARRSCKPARHSSGPTSSR